MADDKPISSKIPKDYPVSPDIEDRRYEHAEEEIPGMKIVREPSAPAPSSDEIVLHSKPGYGMARKARKQ